ncbi:MAG: hypothetical protein OHK0029_26390 [Armatimonadaceae bacterium]
MISPRMMRTPMSARQAKTLFIAHVVRHLFGMGLIIWLVTVFGMLGEQQWIMIVAGAVYIAFAVFNSVKLWNLYQRRLAAERNAGTAEGNR